MADAAMSLLTGFTILVLWYFVVLNSYYVATSLFSFRALRKYSRRLNSLDVENLIRSAGAPPVTVLMPAYNEEVNCVESVQSLMALKYPDYEIIVINDGSSDGTLERLRQSFALVPGVRAPTSALPTESIKRIYRSRTHANLWVIDKENGGKSDALNAGVNYCQSPLFCAMDADSILEPEALVRLVRPFLEDGSTIAAGGIVRVANGCEVRNGRIVDVRLPKKLLPQLQVIEYLRAFLAGRMGWSSLDVLLIVSGAFGIFRRSSVVDVGGYYAKTVGEDMELIVRLHRHYRERKMPYRISFVPDPVAWTEAPESLRGLAKQRDRWQRGLLQSLGRHRRMLLSPKYGRIGMIAFPYFWFMEGLGPVVEVFGYVAFAIALAMGALSPLFVIAFLLLAFVCGILLSVAAVGLEELVYRRYRRGSDFVRLMLLGVIENFGYRQLLAALRFMGTISAITGRTAWGKPRRQGVLRTPPTPPPTTEKEAELVSAHAS